MSRSFHQGDIIYINLTRENGINPKEGYDSRFKYYVVLGFDHNEMIVGGVVINSTINPRLPLAIKNYHYPLSATDYAFLQHNSFINCGQLITARIDLLAMAKHIGTLSTQDLEIILSSVREVGTIQEYQLKRFGLQ